MSLRTADAISEGGDIGRRLLDSTTGCSTITSNLSSGECRLPPPPPHTTYRRVSACARSTRTIPPMIDHTMGNEWPSMATTQNVGRGSERAIHVQTKAPKKPSTIDRRNPPREPPPNARATEPQIPATKRYRTKSIGVMAKMLQIGESN